MTALDDAPAPIRSFLPSAAELGEWSVDWLPAERSAWAPPERTSVSDWSDRNRVLSRLVSAEPGPWRTARVPYLREIMDSFAVRGVEQVTLCKSTQVGGTEAFHNVIGWVVDQDPRPIVLVMPRKEDAIQVIGRRLQPMFEDSPTLSGHLTGWAKDWKQTELGFSRCVLYGRGSNSPSDLASVAGGLLIGDEADKWPGYSGKEATPWDLAKERTRTFPSRKIGLVSTPTIEAGLIWQEFLAGDRRRYHVPCPHCEGYQVLRWENVRWDEELEDRPRLLKRRRAAWYVCESCGEKIDDAAKRDMLLRGVWCPEEGRVELEDGEPVAVVDHDVGDHRSYHLWAGYSPWLAWAEIVVQWLESRDKDERLQNFVNSWLGEPYRETVEETTQTGVAGHVRAYERDTVDERALVLTAGVDVQKAEMPYVIRAWGHDGESWLVRAGFARSWESLEELLLGDWGPRNLRVRLAAVDARHRSDEVYDLARQHPDIVRAIRGVQRAGPQPFTTTKIDRHPVTGRPYRNSLIVWNVDVDPFRDRLAARICDEADEGPGAWHVHADVGEVYIRQLSSQEKVRPRTAGRQAKAPIWRTKAGHRADHLWDCEVYALVAATMIGADRIRSADSAPAPLARHRAKTEAIRAARQARRERGGQGWL